MKTDALGGLLSGAITCVWLTVGISECSGMITNLSKVDRRVMRTSPNTKHGLEKWEELRRTVIYSGGLLEIDIETERRATYRI